MGKSYFAKWIGPLLLGGGLWVLAWPAWSQGTQVRFGKNRVQYHQDFADWSQYESDNFITYWYGEGRNIGQAAVQIAEYDFKEIQNLLEHRLNDKIEIIVYTDLTDLKQSNIGSEEAFMNTGGQTKIVGSKIFIYFNGDHNHLRRQIREGISSVFMESMLFGSSLQEIVQNAVMMNLPEWFKQGLVAYVGDPWNTRLDEELRERITDEDFEGFDRFAEEHPKLAGHSMWYFISENFGPSTVSNLLYLTRINRSIESGFLYVLGSPYEMVVENWKYYFLDRYQTEAAERTYPQEGKVEFRNKRQLPVTQAKLSPDGRKLLYVTNEIGKYKVYLQDLATGERKRIFKRGFRNAFQATDYNYPLLAWNPNNQEIAILYEKRDIPRLLRIDLTNNKKVKEELATRFQRVYSMDYTSPNTLIFSGAIRGFSDLYMYYLNTRQSQRLTNDIWDDLDARFARVGKRRGILFASNRPDSILQTVKLDTVLPINSFDLYFMDLSGTERELVRVTNTPLANERQPIAIDTSYFGYLSDRSGIYNREVARLEEYIHHYEKVITLIDGDNIRIHADSTLTGLDSTLIDTITLEPVIKTRAVKHNNTNRSRSIQQQDAAPRAGKVVEVYTTNGTPEIFTLPLEPEKSVDAPPTDYLKSYLSLAERKASGEFEEPPFDNILREQKRIPTPKPDEPQMPPISKPEPDTGKIDVDNYLFQSEFDDEEEAPQVTITEAERTEADTVPPQISILDDTQAGTAQSRPAADIYRFRPGKITPYRLKFRTDFVTLQLDNSLLFEGLNTFAASPDQFGYPPPGIFLKGNWKDLFEDYEFEGGVRVPTTFDGSEYYLLFRDKKKRIDKEYAVYRRSQRIDQPALNNIPQRAKNRILLGQVELRYPLDIFRSIRTRVTLRDDRVTQLASERTSLETPTQSQQRVGLRLEYVFDNTLEVSLNILNGTRYKVFAEVYKRFNVQVLDGFSFDFGEGYMGVIGFDFRHYQRLLKHSVIAMRAAGATSFGQERIIYYLGGVDNWLFPSFSENIPTPSPTDATYAFQALAAPLRGFPFNIRNGSTYALVNAEVRIPVFKYLIRRIKSSFLRNFQVVGFFDAGTAWEGSSPFSEDNPLNINEEGENLINIRVKFFRDPLVAGYGVGARTKVFGYFLRFDYAWGIETRQIQDPRFYFSLGTDF